MDNAHVDVSVIIPSHNDRRWLEISLPSITSQKFKGNYEVILVDNASTDGSVEFVTHSFPAVRILKLTRNLGYAGGCNEGARIARGDYMVIFNDDVEVESNWLHELYFAAKENPEYKILGSSDQFFRERNFNAYFEVVGIGKPLTDNSARQILPSLFSSGNFLMPRSWLDEIGFLFEAYYQYDDAELSIRTIFAGGKIGYVTSSRFKHFAGAEFGIRQASDLSRKSRSLAWLSARYKIMVIVCSFDLQNVLKLFIVHSLFLGLVLARRSTLLGGYARLRGTLEGLLRVGALAEKRRLMMRLKQRGDSYLFDRLAFNPNSPIQRAFVSFLRS